MKVRDVMRKAVVSMPQNATLRDIVAKFQQQHLDCLPIVDAAERVVGFMTIHDLIEIFLPRYYDLLRDLAVLDDEGQMAALFESAFVGLQSSQRLILAADVLKPNLACVNQDDSLLQAAARFQTQGQHRLPVVDRDQKLVGLLSSFEIVLALLRGSVAVHG